MASLALVCCTKISINNGENEMKDEEGKERAGSRNVKTKSNPGRNRGCKSLISVLSRKKGRYTFGRRRGKK
jgi:hypothetical protein